MPNVLESIAARAHFVWAVDEKVVFSYGPTYHPEFFAIKDYEWRNLGEPKTILLKVTAI